MKFRKPYDPPKRVTTDPVGETMTRQAHKDETDINFVLAQYKKSGIAAHLNKYQGQYGEFHDMDYHAAMQLVRDADEMFLSVPAEIRKRFGNDPQEFVDFVTNPDNVDELRRLKLLPKEQPPAPAPAPEPEPTP